MAEAAVEERPPARFYCHMCNVEFQNDANNYTCPHCSDGFIEELQENREEDSRSTNSSAGWTSLEDSDLGDAGFLLSTRLGPRGPENGGPMEGRTLTRLASSNLRQQLPIEHLVHDFIINLGVGVNLGGPGNFQLFLGNPGDYAWGREGLDAIVTQLLNQMDNTGPPPVSKAVIDALQVVEVTQEQVSINLQCSVCWEDFTLKEQVRQLPCQHVYHEACIRPWLELHGTCPICRQKLVDGDGRPGANDDQEDPYYSEALHTIFTDPSSSSGSNQMDQSGSNSSSPTSFGGGNVF